VIAVRVEPAAGPIVALPDPSARVGEVVRFALAEQLRGGRTRRIGEISARITARSRIVKAARALAPGTVIDEAAVIEADADLDGVLLRPLPAAGAVIGARVRRPIAEGAIVAAQDVIPAPLVSAGRPVTVRVSLGSVIVTGQMIAAESGSLGEIVRVVNAETRRTERARVIAPAEVEMVDVR
jgi:flagella basal body P-ring formation protein FlgA